MTKTKFILPFLLPLLTFEFFEYPKFDYQNYILLSFKIFKNTLLPSSKFLMHYKSIKSPFYESVCKTPE